MDEVIAGIDDRDIACIALGVDFIEEDDSFCFGKILKSNTARSLRRCGLLTESQKERIQERVVSMLIAGNTPHEMKEYIKLLRVVGVNAATWERLQQDIPRDKPCAMRFYQGLRMATGLPIER
jgi:ribosomal protein S13